jgi:hypothetical protein
MENKITPETLQLARESDQRCADLAALNAEMRGLPINTAERRDLAIRIERRRYFMGEFALILAAKGHLVDYQTLDRLADVAIGDV